MLPLATEHFAGQLTEQERTLAELSHSIDDVAVLVPAYGQTAAQLAGIGRLLAWLTAVLIALHGLYLLLSVRLGERYSA